MVAPKRKWTDVLGHMTNRTVDHNKILREAMGEIVTLHQPLPLLSDPKQCQSCDDDFDWPCETYKLAWNALAKTSFKTLLDEDYT